MTVPGIRKGRQSGLTLVELMVAMVLGLLVTGGIITVFISTSASNKAQQQMARLQEDGRFAVARLGRDIGMANAQYCNGSGGNATASEAGPYLDQLRAPMVYAHSASNDMVLDALSDVTTSWGTPYPAKPDAPFMLPEFLSMRGHDCSKTGCTPEDPHDQISGIPAPGTDIGDRVVGTSVLTLRYLDPSRGWKIGHAGGSNIDAGSSGAISEIHLSPLADEPGVDEFGANNLAMLANCSTAQIFAVQGQGTATLKPTGANFTQPSAMHGTAALRLFDFDRAFQTVTYYLKVVEDGNGHKTGALIRRVNGNDSNKDGSEQEMVRGIERLDFRYGVLNEKGKTRFITANEIDTGTDTSGNAIACPSRMSMPVDKNNSRGCLWRAVKSIEVDLVMNGQVPLHSLSTDDLAYTYAGDDIHAPRPPDQHAIKPHEDQGFPRNLLRREFTALIAVRSYNP